MKFSCEGKKKKKYKNLDCDLKLNIMVKYILDFDWQRSHPYTNPALLLLKTVPSYMEPDVDYDMVDIIWFPLPGALKVLH